MVEPSFSVPRFAAMKTRTTKVRPFTGKHARKVGRIKSRSASRRKRR